MSHTLIVYGATSIFLFCLGLHSLVTRRHLLRKIMGLNIMAGGVFLLFMTVAHRNRDVFADPVPQAMVLTGIVVSICATGFALALARRIYSKTGRTTLSDRDPSGEDL